MPMSLESMLDNVDAAVFSGDSLEDLDNRQFLRENCERWLQALDEREEKCDVSTQKAQAFGTEWVAVSDRMPPPNIRCLVWFDGDCIGIAHTFVKYNHPSHPLGYLIQGHGGSHNSVTHWMPLPASPS